MKPFQKALAEADTLLEQHKAKLAEADALAVAEMSQIVINRQNMAASERKKLEAEIAAKDKEIAELGERLGRLKS